MTSADLSKDGLPAEEMSSSTRAARRAEHAAAARNFAVLAGFLRLRAFGTEKQSADFIADEITRKGTGATPCAQTIEGLHALFSRPIREGALELGDDLEEVCAAMRPLVLSAGAVEIFCEFEPDCPVSKEAVLPIALIVCEMILNATRYAHPAGAPGRIDVGCRRNGKRLFVEVADDGIGLPEKLDPARSGHLGFEMVRTLAKQIRGKTLFESDPLGLRFQLTLPS